MSDPITSNTGDVHTEDQAGGHGSTGPRTEAGKQRSSRNSLKHGLAASDLQVAAGEEEEFEDFKADLLLRMQPCDAVQMVFFNSFLQASWSLLRIGRMEAEYLLQGPEALTDPNVRKALELLHRYQSRHERSLYRAKKELEQLQTAGVIRQLLPEEVDNAVPPMANPMKIHIAKRTADKAWEEEQITITRVPAEPGTENTGANGSQGGTEANRRQ